MNPLIFEYFPVNFSGAARAPARGMVKTEFPIFNGLGNMVVGPVSVDMSSEEDSKLTIWYLE